VKWKTDRVAGLEIYVKAELGRRGKVSRFQSFKVSRKEYPETLKP
jgi:hypothetical protein